MSVVAGGREFGDRHAFLARAATNASRSHTENLAHPLPPASSAEGLVPIGYRLLDASDLVASYLRNAKAALLDVHRLAESTPTDEFLRALIDAEKVQKVVVTGEPRAVAVGERLAALGCEVSTYGREAAIDADLGVSSPAFGIAAIGSLVQDSSLEGSRGASLVPRVHLALLPTDRIVGTTADVLSTFGSRTNGMPANSAVGTLSGGLSSREPRPGMPANSAVGTLSGGLSSREPRPGMPANSAVGTLSGGLSSREPRPVMPANSAVGTLSGGLSSREPRPGMPANIVFISGPSRTGDIEMILTIGVHGPVKVVVCVVEP